MLESVKTPTRLVRELGAAGAARGDLLSLAAAQVAPIPIQAGLSLLTAVALLPAERGSAVFVVSAGSIGASILFGSFHVGAVAALKAGDRRAFMRVNGCVGGLSAALVASSVWVAVEQPTGSGLYNAENLLLILTGLSMMIPFLYISRTMQGLGLSSTYRTVTLVLTGSYAAGALIALFPIGLRTAAAVTIPWLASTALALLLALGLFWRNQRAMPSLTGNSGAPGVQAVRASLSAHFGSVSQQLAYRADLYLLGLFATAAAIGVYTLAVSISEMVWVVAEIAALSVFADDEVRRGSQWQSHVQRRIGATLRVTFGVSVLTVGASAVFLLVLLPAYRASFPLLLMLLPGMVLAAGSRVLLAALTARDKRRLLLLTAVMALVLTLPLVPAIALFGVLGAAIGSSVVYAAQFLLVRRLWARAA